MLSATVCAGGRMALRSSVSRTLTRVALPHRGRLVSFQRLQLGLTALPSQQGSPNARNFWSSKTPTTLSGSTTAGHSIPAPAPVEETAAFSGTSQESTAAVNASTPAEIVSPSTDTIPVSDSLSELLPADATSNLSEVAVNVIPPLQYGDFATLGLATWWPSGIVSWSFELLQVSTGMPWFHAIVVGTLFWRALLIPNSIASLRNAARLRPFNTQVTELDKQMTLAQTQAAKMEIMLKKRQILQTAGVSMGSGIIAPIAQLVGNLSLFFAVKNMTTLPLIQLTQSGFSWLPDLTATGDYVMPALMLAAMNVQLSLMKPEMDPSKTTFIHAVNVMKVVSWISLPMMSWMPVGVWLSTLTGLCVLSLQSIVLRVPRIRQMVSLPPFERHPPVSLKDTYLAIKEWYLQRLQDAAAQDAMDKRKPNFTTLPKSRNMRPRR